MITKDFETRLRIGIVRGFKAKIMDAHFRKKDFHETDEAAECEAEIGNNAFYLVELGEMGGVDAFVAEYAVDGEVTGRAGVGG